MSPTLDSLTQQFIDFSQGKKVLEIGGAYGKVMIKTLKHDPTTQYYLNDLESKHLFIAAENFKTTQPKIISKQTPLFLSGDIIQGLEIKEQFDAILIARVLHFFSPSQLNRAIFQLKKLLKPGGRIFVVGISPYVKRYEKFIPEYERRQKNQIPFAGHVQSLYDWVNKEATSTQQLKTISKGKFLFLDPTTLKSVFQKTDFKIITCKLFPLGYYSDSWSLDGRENVMLIAARK